MSKKTIRRAIRRSSKRSHVERLSGTNGNGYRGRQSKTKSGKKCGPWAMSGTHTKEKFARSGMEGNYCRNPDFKTKNTIWCFTDFKTKKWEYCNPIGGSSKSKQRYASNVHAVRVQSAGYKAGNYARIMMNGQRVNMKSGRGLNVVAWTRKWK